MKKYKVIGFELEFCHHFEIGETVELVEVWDEECGLGYYKNKEGLKQVLIGSEVEAIEE